MANPRKVAHTTSESAGTGPSCVQAFRGAAEGTLTFCLNGEQIVLESPDPTQLLIDFLRSAGVGLTGTKLSCGEGGCGACTVMLSRYDPGRAAVIETAVNACLRPLCSLDGMMITTTEGIGSVRGKLDPVQRRIAACNGSQCGFCTPGFVMNIYTRLRQNARPTQQEIEDGFDGHICRCTGYRPILQAMRSFAVDFAEQTSYWTDHPLKVIEPVELRLPGKEPSVRFPEELLAYAKRPRPLAFQGRGYEWFRPVTLAQVQLLKRHLGKQPGDFKLIVGNTSIGIYKTDVEDPHILVEVSAVPEMRGFAEDPDGSGFRVGASNTLQELVEYLAEVMTRLEPEQTAGLAALHRHLLDIANLQVRNVGSLAGNVMMTRAKAETDQPFPSDLYLVFTTLGVSITVASEEYEGGRREFAMLELPAPAQLPDDAVAVGFHIPYAQPGEQIQTYKVASRHQNAHALVNAGFRVALGQTGEVQRAVIAYGGIAPLIIRLGKTEAYLIGKRWTDETLSGALGFLAEEIAGQVRPMPGSAFLPEGYRESLTETLFYRFFVHVANSLFPEEVQPRHRSAGDPYIRPLSGGRQTLELYPDEAPVGEPLIKQSAFIQASGERKYTHDVPLPPRGLEAAFVLSRRALARFTYRDPGGARGVAEKLRTLFPGVQGFITVADVPGSNVIGMGGDDPLFADGEVICWGQPIGLVVAEDRWTAVRAARYVEQELIAYEEQPGRPPVLTIEEALSLPDRTGLFPDEGKNVHISAFHRAGSDETWLQHPEVPMESGRVVQGSQRTGAQAQFYMETQACLAIPGEPGTIDLYSSTQQANAVQASVAAALQIPTSSVQVYVPPSGGGFGGKQFRPAMIAGVAAVAAWVLNRPVRLILDRNTDMAVIGKRHPFLGTYHACATEDGLIRGLKIRLISDGGSTYDCSFPLMDLSQQHTDGAYFVPTFETSGDVARTNNASNTAMRSFGIIQATLVVEEAIEQVAHSLGMVPEEVRRKNLYQTGQPGSFQRTPFGEALDYCVIREIWDSLHRSAAFEPRRLAVEEFNRTNRWRKRGIAMTPVKYGVGYQPRFLDQGAALVMIYASDGSVLVQHGGSEIGQGIDTKMRQIAAATLGIPMELIRVGQTWTGGIANATATAASSGSDLFGGAVRLACQELRRRLERFCAEQRRPGWKEHWSEQWKEIIQGAYDARVELTSDAFYRVPRLQDVEGDHPYGRAFRYFTFSAAVSEVEIDVLTGETTLLRTDILYDGGKSLNPCLDIGQIEGGFVQGVGLMTTEQMMYEADGRLYSQGTWDYKPPCSKSIPLDFRVTLHHRDRLTAADLDSAPDAAVMSSRAVGEPPLVLSTSVFFAVKHAILAARRDQGDPTWFELPAPATVSRIQQACQVDRSHLRL